MCKTKKYIISRCEEIKNYYYESIKEIEKINNNKIKKIVLLCMFDSLSQDYSKYPENNNDKAFINFLEKFIPENIHDDLCQINTITLYYNYIDKNKNDKKIDDITKYIDDNYPPENLFEVLNKKEIINIKNYIKNHNFDKYFDSHNMKKLLYKYRSILLHTFTEPASFFSEFDDYNYIPVNTIFYISSNKTENIAHFFIPYAFLKKMFFDCLNNYLKYCVKQKKNPFEYNLIKKSWYEKIYESNKH